MPTHPIPELHLSDAGLGVVGAFALMLVMSLLPEPIRRRFNAVFVAGAGAAYLSGGLGPWEFLFTSVMTVLAYRGLDAYRFIGLAWLFHVGWDVLHHLYGDPIVWCVPTSSAQCAVCDTILAAWFFAGAPSLLPGSGRRS